jgi:hypothetical protein
MRVQELISKMNTEGFNLAEAIETKIYLPINLKKVIAQEIVYDCTSEDNGVIKVDSFERYMSYVRHMITEHTNLEYTDDDYDVLCSTEYNGDSLLGAIIGCFGEDAKECSRILEMVMGDYMQDTTLESILAKTLHNLEINLSKFAEKIADNTKNMIPEGMDIEGLGKLIEKLGK